MTDIERKAKAYDELFAKAKTMMVENTNEVDGAKILTKLFPQLAESEDEKIRKAILWCISTVEHEFGCKVIEGFAATELKSWLEKKGKNNMGISEDTKQKLEDNLNKALEKETPESWNEFLEKQGEQRPVIVPKFMVGDFIKLKKDSDETYEVSKIEIFDTDEIYYHLTNGGCVGENADNFELVKHKPADKTEPKFKVGDIISNGTSEVKIIEVNDNSYSVTNDEIENDCNLSNWVVYFKNQDNWKLVEQKPVWSEEDETKIKSIITFLKSPALCAMESNKGIIDASIKYLKSLKERYTWKPSDEQMKALAEALSLAKNCGEENAFDLRTLLEQLEAL